ncbi:hypothetical protein L873DRAFT_1687318, partial [Choiromyces venosus 120613-1]
TVKLLLQCGDVNLDSADNDDRIPLSYATTSASLKEGILKQLPERRDIIPDLSDNKGCTPLSYAVEWGREDAVKLLLQMTGF